MTATGAGARDSRRSASSTAGLRPLRIRELTIGAGERVSLGGLDAGAGELLVNLVTGASVPDQGEVRVFGQPHRRHRRTAMRGWSCSNGSASCRRAACCSRARRCCRTSRCRSRWRSTRCRRTWPRRVEALRDGVRTRSGPLAAECRAGELPADVRVLAHLARALALGPDLIVIEHPTADVAPAARAPLAAAIARACDARRRRRRSSSPTMRSSRRRWRRET